MDDNSSTPTALMKIFGDFDSRVRTASRRTFEGNDGLARHPSGSSISSAFKGSNIGSLSRKLSTDQGGLRARLKFDESNTFESPSQQNRLKRPSSVLDDPLKGLERYPKAVKSDDARQMQSEIERLKMHLIQKDADIVSLEAEIKQGQAILRKIEFDVAKDKLAREKEHEVFVRQARIDEQRISELEAQVSVLRQRKEHQQEEEAFTSKVDKQRPFSSEYQHEVDRLTEEVNQLRDENYEVRTEAEAKEAGLREELNRLQALNEELEANVQIFKEKIPKQEPGQAIETQTLKDRLEEAQLQVKKLQSELQLVNEDSVQHKIMRRRLDNYSQMEREVKSLRVENKLLNDTAENTQLLKVQIEDLKEKLSSTEALLEESRLRQDTLVFAERKLNQWKNLSFQLLNASERASIGNDFGPELLKSKMSEMQQELLGQASEIVNLKSALKEKEQELTGQHGIIEEINQKSQVDKQNLNEQANLIKRFKRKLLLVTKERDSYKGVLESYEHELTFTGAAFEKDRVTALETALNEYRETVERLEDLLCAARSQKETELEAQLKAENATLKENILKLESAAGVAPAAQDDPDFKILHFTHNPLSQAVESRQKEFEEVKAENVALKARIKLLEEGQTKDLTLLVGQKVDEGASSEEVRELKEQLKAAEIRKQRLIEAFKKTSQDFREVSYRLTGFRIDGLADGKYRLSPVYAETPNEYLLFKREESGECMLLETEYSAQEHVQNLIRLHLQEQNSVPVFLAAVITDMFSRQTFDAAMDEPASSSPVPIAEANEEEEEFQEEEEVVEEEEEDESVHDEEEVGEEEMQEESEDDREDDDDDDIVCID